MRKFFSSWKFKVFAVIGCLLIGLMLRAYSVGGVSTGLNKIVGVIISPVENLSSKISGGCRGVIQNIVSLSSEKAENEKLKKQIKELRSQIVDYNQIKRENQQLSGLVDVTKEDNSYKCTSAMVISRNPDQWSYTFTIDKGTVNGIKTDEPVITTDGLVGLVTNTMPTTSVVTSVIDPSCHVGAIVSQTGETGITKGVGELAKDGEFQLSYLSKNTSVSSGNIVITSGIGGIYPKNLKVGIVQKVENDISGTSINAVLRPMIDISSIKNVFVVTSFSGKQDGGK